MTRRPLVYALAISVSACSAFLETEELKGHGPTSQSVKCAEGDIDNDDGTCTRLIEVSANPQFTGTVTTWHSCSADDCEPLTHETPSPPAAEIVAIELMLYPCGDAPDEVMVQHGILAFDTSQVPGQIEDATLVVHPLHGQWDDDIIVNVYGVATENHDMTNPELNGSIIATTNQLLAVGSAEGTGTDTFVPRSQINEEGITQVRVSPAIDFVQLLIKKGNNTLDACRAYSTIHGPTAGEPHQRPRFELRYTPDAVSP